MNKTLISRRALCLLLCALMIVPVLLTACGGDVVNTGDQTAKTAQTMTIAMIKDEGMTDEAIELVEKAINEITEGQLNTHIELLMFTEDEYQEKVLEMSKELQINRAGPGSKYVSSQVIREEGKNYQVQPNGDTVEIDEANRSHTVYPTLTNTQLDVILINSAETYNKLVAGSNEMSYLSGLAEVVGASGTDMKKKINTTTMNFMSKINPELYAIPNNTFYGEYSYMLINKEYFDELNYDIGLISDLASAKDFLNDIMNKEEYNSVIPVYNFTGFEFLSYYGFESPLGRPYSTSYSMEVVFGLTDIMKASYYTTAMQLIYDCYKSDNPYVETDTIDFEKDFAIGFMKGGYEVPKTHKDIDGDGTDDYYVVTLSNPHIDNKLFESMYAVSAFTKSVERSFEIVQLLETDERIVNLLAYGVEDVHYEMISGEVVPDEENTYKMNYRYAGNNFLLKPSAAMDEQTKLYAANGWEYAKKHNEKAIMDPYCGFVLRVANFNEYEFVEPSLDKPTGGKFVELDDKSGVQVRLPDGSLYKSKGKTMTYLYTDVIVEELRRTSADFVKRMYDFEEASKYESYAEYLKVLAAEFEATDAYSQATGNATNTNDTYSNPFSPASQYRDYWNKIYRS